MKIHEYANIFPLMNDKEFKELKEDISKNGLMDPIITFDGKILDGRNRFNVCKEIGVEPKFKEYKEKDPLQYVMSTNLKRRQLTQSQKAVVGIRYKKVYAVWAKKRMIAGKPSELVHEGEKGRASNKAGEQVGVSGRYIDEAENLIGENPEAEKEIMEEGKEITKIKREIKEKKREKERQEDKKKVNKIKSPEELFSKVKFTTIVIDPPWDLNDEGDVNQLGRAKQDYASIPFKDLKKLPINNLTKKDAHIYLWITNRSLPKGFQLLKEWGFRYITCLTWCKPSFGMGNYFRGSTEQILFGVKGKLPLNRKDVGTWFQAQRGKLGHSSKPEEFYKLVESCSPGLYLDYFGRKKRKDWYLYGNEIK